MGDDERAGTAVRTGHGLGYPHDRWEPCLPPHPPGSPTRPSPTRQARTLPRPWGLGGLEPPTSSLSAKCREPLCYAPFSQVTSDRRGRSYPRRNLDAGLTRGRLPRSGGVQISSYFRTLLVCALIAFSYVLSSRPPPRGSAHQPCSPWWCGCPWSLGPSRGPSASRQQPGWP